MLQSMTSGLSLAEALSQLSAQLQTTTGAPPTPVPISLPPSDPIKPDPHPARVSSSMIPKGTHTERGKKKKEEEGEESEGGIEKKEVEDVIGERITEDEVVVDADELRAAREREMKTKAAEDYRDDGEKEIQPSRDESTKTEESEPSGATEKIENSEEDVESDERTEVLGNSSDSESSDDILSESSSDEEGNDEKEATLVLKYKEDNEI